ncbi:hypothetical protein MBAV_005093 [Candidatus Magnetobacterium bavaricum]|uniref:Uncharacterized protein n=1 Tax=Candidatus Magnetobacterium bavaricum TaxID=29290 RepID=A0A0F3GPU6_9BACT|nr:hypothetical protein MBAV_005093 [Candidatus Magnetobacterium bavaricum]
MPLPRPSTLTPMYSSSMRPWPWGMPSSSTSALVSSSTFSAKTRPYCLSVTAPSPS